MKVLFLTDYFFPFIHGGAEISIANLGAALSKKGVEVHLLTPNYGTKSQEVIDNVFVTRFNFPAKLSEPSAQLTPLWHFNPIHWFSLTSSAMKLIGKSRIDIIHCQSASSIIPGIIAGKVMRKPVVITFRDSQILCNYGHCLTKDQFGQTCTLAKFIKEDFPHYYADKVMKKNLINKFFQLSLGLGGRLRVKTLKFFAGFATKNIVSSTQAQKTFAKNGIAGTLVIHNIFDFPNIFPKHEHLQNKILYATKLSKGKGLDLLLEAWVKVKEKFPKLTLEVVGAGNVKGYQQQANKLKIGDSVKFNGRLENSRIMSLRKQCLLEVCPSIYPESFGRSALEAIAVGLPVVVSNRGGLTDIVENNKTGLIVEPTSKELSKGIIAVVEENKKFRANLKREFHRLKKKFGTKPVEDHLKLYRRLL